MRKANERSGGHGDLLGQMETDHSYKTPREVAFYNKAKLRALDTAFECFDYIMNYRSTYVALGEAVRFFERSMGRGRNTIKQELVQRHGKGGPHPWSLVGLKRWHRAVYEVVGNARKDYEKNFPVEEGDIGPVWLRDVQATVVLLIAMKYRDRWAP